MGIRLPICIALALAGTLHVSANVTDMRCEYRVDPINTHFLQVISMEDDLKREFYLTMAVDQRWSVYVL